MFVPRSLRLIVSLTAAFAALINPHTRIKHTSSKMKRPQEEEERSNSNTIDLEDEDEVAMPQHKRMRASNSAANLLLAFSAAAPAECEKYTVSVVEQRPKTSVEVRAILQKAVLVVSDVSDDDDEDSQDKRRASLARRKTSSRQESSSTGTLEQVASQDWRSICRPLPLPPRLPCVPAGFKITPRKKN